MSRRRELGEETDWSHAFEVVKSPSFGAIFVLGLLLAAIFFVWVLTAHGIYYATFGDVTPTWIGDFLGMVLTTGAGWVMIYRRHRGRVLCSPRWCSPAAWCRFRCCSTATSGCRWR